MRTWFVILLVVGTPAVTAGALAAARDVGGTPRAFRQPVTAAAGTEAGLLVVTPAGVKVLDSLGRPRNATWPDRGRVGERRPRPAVPAPSVWPGLTADTDFTGATYDPDDIDDGDDPRLADDVAARPWDIDEGSTRARASRTAAGASALQPLVAAAGDAGWVLREDGVWKVGLRDGTATRVYACDGHHVHALAAGGGRGDAATVALVDGDQLLRAAKGQTFERIGGPVPHVRGLAIAGAATVVVLDSFGGLRTYAGPADDGPILFRDRVDDIATCSPEVLVLRGGELFALTATGARRLGPAPPGTERLACGAGGGGWVAFGAAVHVSGDQGRTWTPRQPFAVRPILGLVPTRAALWLVVPPGAWPLPAVGQAAEPTAPAGPGPAGIVLSGRQAARAARRPSDFWRRWGTLLPEIDLDFEVGRVGAVREVRGLLAASFRLDGLWSGGLPPRGRAGRVWDAGPDVGATLELDAAMVGASDPISTAERRALARILEEHP